MTVSDPLGANHPDNPVISNVREIADLIQCSAVGLACVGPDGVILRANSAEAEMLGFDTGEYIGRHAGDFFAPREAITQILKEVGAGATVRSRALQKQGKDGRLRDILVTAIGVFEAGRFSHATCLSVDATGRNRSGEATSLLASIVESSTDAIVSKTLDGTILSWNAGAARLFEYSAEEAIGSKITLIIPPELMHEEDLILSRIRQGERIEHLNRARKQERAASRHFAHGLSGARRIREDCSGIEDRSGHHRP